ncbi:hypothetical protein CIHG_10286 [Coccidioides immitis H538.4]|uniref:Uncharacterized protein n=1 Tax=Coccidioides immitis H538.4 TaxID=396776 RepID=A0A0J8UX11_COCIT|nr:hypothetical protein CIHG_10286 [Coccidioides immitis H538.4]
MKLHVGTVSIQNAALLQTQETALRVKFIRMRTGLVSVTSRCRTLACEVFEELSVALGARHHQYKRLDLDIVMPADPCCHT